MNQNLDNEKENPEKTNGIELKFVSKGKSCFEDNYDWDWIFDKGWLRIKK